MGARPLLRVDEVIQACFVGMLVVVAVRVHVSSITKISSDDEAKKPPNYVAVFVVTFVIVCIMLRAFRDTKDVFLKSLFAGATKRGSCSSPPQTGGDGGEDLMTLEEMMRYVDLQDPTF